MTSTEPTIEALRVEFAKLLDPKEPLDSRMRELYRLKEKHIHTPAAALLLLEGIDTTDSVLLQHEMAYNVGQTGQPEAGVPGLERVVRDLKYDAVTRHEAAEALGALGSPAALQVLRDHADPEKEVEVAVRETCELAIARIVMQEKKGEKALKPPADCPFVSVDPSPAITSETFAALTADGFEIPTMPKTVEELGALLLDQSGKTRLFVRYMAMFSLRNLASNAAIEVLMRALREDKTSCLFRHEVAFVLGQLEHPVSQPALIEALKDEGEAAMVRHEAAEALGAIADPKTLPVLEEYAKHPEPIVRDSCVVALEMHKYWAQFNNKNKTDSDGETQHSKKVRLTREDVGASDVLRVMCFSLFYHCEGQGAKIVRASRASFKINIYIFWSLLEGIVLILILGVWNSNPHQKDGGIISTCLLFLQED
eukprot:gene3949-2812_t